MQSQQQQLSEIINQYDTYMNRWSVISPNSHPEYNFQFTSQLGNNKKVNITLDCHNIGFVMREFNVEQEWKHPAPNEQQILDTIRDRCSRLSPVHHNRISTEEELFCPETLWRIINIENVSPQIFADYAHGKDFRIAMSDINKWWQDLTQYLDTLFCSTQNYSVILQKRKHFFKFESECVQCNGAGQRHYFYSTKTTLLFIHNDKQCQCVTANKKI